MVNQFVEVEIDNEERCSSCGSLIAANALFCGQCGTKRKVIQHKGTTCIRCGEALSASFCDNCGLEYEDDPNGTVVLEQRLCANCGTELAENQDFCSKCGTSGAEAKLGQRKMSAICPRCGSPVVEGKTFCMACGGKWENMVRPILQNNTLQCPACGQGGMQTNRTACFSCGVEFVESQWNCSHCGKENEYAARACAFCGFPTGPGPVKPEPNVAKKNWIKTSFKPIRVSTGNAANTQQEYRPAQTVSSSSYQDREEETSIGGWIGWKILIYIFPLFGAIIMYNCVKSKTAKNYAALKIVMWCIGLFFLIFASDMVFGFFKALF